MSAEAKRERECLWVKSALACMGCDSAVVSTATSDPPDVQVRLNRKLVGVEVTQYHRDLGGDNRSGLRAAEARIGEIESCFSDTRGEFQKLKVDGEVFFVERDESVGRACADRLPLLPAKNDIKLFVRELLTFASEVQPALSDEGLGYESFDAARFPLLAHHVRRLQLCPFDFTPVWVFTPEAVTHRFSQDVCVAHVNKKDAVITSALRKDPERFQQFEELWLLLVSELSSRSSQSFSTTLGILQGACNLNRRATESHFDSILFFRHSKPPRLFVWRRGQGWSQPGGSRE